MNGNIIFRASQWLRLTKELHGLGNGFEENIICNSDIVARR